MTRRLVVVAALVVAALVGASAAPAGAVDAVESGWWWREQPEGGSIPPPPHVPPGGLRVSSDATGPSAVSAVRIPLGDGEADPVLTLKVAGGAADGAVVNACPVKAAWTPASAGAWASRPEPDCSRGAVVGSVDGGTVTFDLSTIAGGSDVVDVVLFTTPQALPIAPATASPTVDVAFAKPVAGDVAVRTIPSTDGPAATEPFEDAGTPAFDPGGVAATRFETALASPAFDLSPPPAAPATAATPAPAGTTVTRREVAASPVQRVVDHWDREGEARDRLLAAFVFVDLLAAWWLLERRRRQSPAGDRRPRISLHDDPAAVLAAHATHLARRPRDPAVDVPPLR